MNAVPKTVAMSREAFLDWAGAQEERFEFDGEAPVAMTGGTVNHSRMIQNVLSALRSRLRGSGCEPLGPDVGVATRGNAVRFPDAVVFCGRAAGTARLVPEPVVVVEVLSPTSGRIDRIQKVREYAAVASIRHYAILEYLGVGVTLLSRADGAATWTATVLTAEDTLVLPEIGVSVPVAELYEDVTFD